MKKSSGFTMIELLVVITIIGILAAFALPRFINLQTEARIGAIDGLSGSTRAGAALARTKWLAAGSSGSTVDMDGTTVDVTITGYPDASATGIEKALQDTSGFSISHTGGSSTFTITGFSGSPCESVYTEATGVVTVDTSAC